MGVVRTWVFPILRIVLILVIAVALGKLAFFPDQAEEADPAVPTGEIVEPRTVVGIGSITNDVIVQATVSADAAVPVKATAAGTVDEIFVAQGAGVSAGDVVFDVKVEIERDPAASVDAEGKPLPAIFRYVEVTAPASGTLSSLGVIEGQAVTIGEVTGQVAPPTFSVSGTLEPAQQYRLVNQPTEASVAISGGPAPFVCTGLRIITPLPGSTGTDSGGGSGGTGSGGSGGAPGGGAGGGAGSTTVTCPVPNGQVVFSGLTAEMTLAGGQVDNVLVVPMTAVRGAAQTGTVWVSTTDGGTEERAVGLGLSDGTFVEITGGLTEGEEILEFAPGALAVPGGGMEGMENCISLPDGSMSCAG
ncbi:efflux RND transporter periplasmic adaptor subunit [Herbiconiux sp. CPCC 203407]|uniref:Efflux RND transporter periplasmic adaptor subunit n=1 Tax=Herbiconiux oxytropis TaxID=2970915 RepID=A0AA41XEM8_9MICO|nr:efflux RND transporter periplasmic adaptor subunit [Herbiconiux oxytropis]MCS5723964.1 efflux RND transporter periplasmic adaptor subunit [Herbiconiux oxytropis]MCS5726807.1 efflux RND transporter periplasmic adaptor subunit [Herbiconiux oxytropis]